MGIQYIVNSYSIFITCIGSVDAAHWAGKIAAIVAATKSSRTLPATASGSMTAFDKGDCGPGAISAIVNSRQCRAERHMQPARRWAHMYFFQISNDTRIWSLTPECSVTKS
jgi:hypothetical protein